jgi:hypothetical protein
MPGKLQIAGYTYSATGMTGKSDHPARWRTEWIGLKHPTDTNVRGVHAAQFSKTAARFAAGLAAPYARARHRALPRRTKEYSAAAELCLGGAQAAKAALADLQDAAVELGRLQVQGIGRNRLPV